MKKILFLIVFISGCANIDRTTKARHYFDCSRMKVFSLDSHGVTNRNMQSHENLYYCYANMIQSRF